MAHVFCDDKRGDKIDADYIKTVFNKSEDNVIVKKDEYTLRLAKEEVTEELLSKEFSLENEKNMIAKTLLIPRISNNIDMVKFVVENNLLLPYDCMMVILNLIIRFDKTIDLLILDYLYKKVGKIFYSKITVECLNNYLTNTDDTQLINRLFDWYYEKNRSHLVNILSYIMSYYYDESTNIKILDYIFQKNDQEMWRDNKYQLFLIVCKICSFDTFKKCINENSILKLSEMPDETKIHIILVSLDNNDREISKYLIYGEYKNINFEIENFRYVKAAINIGDYDMAKILCKKLKKCDDKEVINYIYEKDNIELLELLGNNIDIDIHYNNDMLFRYFLIDENYKMVEYLLGNQDKYGKFYTEKNKIIIDKIIKFMQNKKVLELLK